MLSLNIVRCMTVMQSGIIAMLVFIASILLTFKQPSVKFPFTSRVMRVDYGLAPLLCAFILLAASGLPVVALLKGGLFGCSYIKPYSVIIFILSLSYICISLDCTGFFEHVSLRVIRASGASGFRLFAYLFLLTSFLTMFTSNDVVILTVTYVILYVSMHARIDPVPFLIAQFFAANVLSMGLYIGNPTNIVIAEAFDIEFLEFARWMLLPSIIATLTCLLLLMRVFRKRIPQRVELPKCGLQGLRDRKGAIFGFSVLGSMLFMISLPEDWIKVQPWIIALSFAMLMVLYDFIFNRSRAKTVLFRMPWKIAPFLIGLFIIVEGLAASGWTCLLASAISRTISENAFITISSVSFISAFAAGLMNNHPMTVFFVKTFKENIASQLSDMANISITSALVIGSNLGANFMLTGSLAGLMWSKILSERGVKISFTQFSKYGFTVMPILILTTSLSLIAILTL